MKDGEERVVKKLRKKKDGGTLEDKKPRRNKLSKTGWAFSIPFCVISSLYGIKLQYQGD